MNDNDTRAEETELVDIGEVSDVLAEKETEEPSVNESFERRSTIATLRERFAAFFIDSIIFFYLYFIIGTFARRAFYGSWSGPIPSFGWQGLAFHGIFIFVCFMYYFILEGVFFTTVGKFLCWMYVRNKTGGFASMSSVFVRNVFRSIDYVIPLFPFFCMELTRKHQRLGDIIGGTTVIKKHSLASVQYSVTMANIASASGRFLSSVIDLVIVGALTFGYLLLLSPETQHLSKWLLLFSPLVPFLYFVISEPITHSTPGKWLFGYVITHEDGASISLAASVIRTFVRLFDSNPLGLLSIWLSPKKQRFGDLAADTIISRQKRRWHGGAALGGWIIISSMLLFFGLQNETSLIQPEFKFNFYPTMEFMGEVAEESAYKELTLTHVRFAAGDVNTFRTPPVFVAGETIFIITDVYGYERSGRMVWIQEDLEIKYPDSSIGLHQENIVDYHQVVPSRAPVQLTNSIKLPESAQGGTYIVSIIVRDLFGHEVAKTKQSFEVKFAPTGPSLNAPPPGSTIPSETNQPPNFKEEPAPSF
jgi:uncharacterized RDD family membrane protein YckC